MNGRVCLVIAAALIGLTGAGVSLNAGAETGRVIHWPAPEGIKPSADTFVTVNGEDIFVYETAVNINRAFTENPELEKTPVALFDFEGAIEIAIRRDDVRTALVRPLSLGISAEVEDGIVRFALDRPAMLTIEFNGETRRCLHLFAGTPEAEADFPSPDDKNVLFFGPGIHERPLVRVKSGQSVYIAGGAVLRGKIAADKAEGIRIYGRGIIDGSGYDRWTQCTVPIDLSQCDNVVIEGITILDPAGWTVSTFKCRNVDISNVKIISARSNSDGFTAQSCQYYTARNCFVRSWDDSLVIKNYDNGVSHDILFKDIIVWTDLAQSCEIGYETRGPEIYNVTFEGITVLHNFHKPVMSIHNSDNAHVHNIIYRDIVVEDARMGGGDAGSDNFLIDLTIAKSYWTQSEERGRISNIRFENITVLDGLFPPSRFMGHDMVHAIDGVSIRGLTILGKHITTLKEGKLRVLSHVKNIEIDIEAFQK